MAERHRKHKSDPSLITAPTPSLNRPSSNVSTSSLSMCICNAVANLVSNLLTLSTQLGVALQQAVVAGGSSVGTGGVIAASIPLFNNLFVNILQFLCGVTGNPACLTPCTLHS